MWCEAARGELDIFIQESREGESGVTKGGHLPPGAAFWGRQIEVGILRNNYK